MTILSKSAPTTVILLALFTSVTAGGRSGDEDPEPPIVLQDESLRATYESRALDGDVRAASLLADYFLGGDSSQREMGIYWLRIYSRNTGKASMALGGLLLASDNTEEQEEGVVIAKELAFDGDKDAIYALARFYHARSDVEMAHFWTERSALLGNVPSMIRLAEYLSEYRDDSSRIMAATWFLIASSHYSEPSFMATSLRERAEVAMAELDESNQVTIRNYAKAFLRTRTLSKSDSKDKDGARVGDD